MIRLHKAYDEGDWLQASHLLHQVVKYLHEIGCPLWFDHQISIEGLQASYKFEELHFISDESNQKLGVVFLQVSDPYFWPEITTADSLFLHKLAINPACKNEGYGAAAIQLIIDEARKRNLRWVRLDCDDREPLHRFYSSNGFQLVDIKMQQEYRIVRYELSLR